MERQVEELHSAINQHEQHMQQIVSTLASTQESLRSMEKRIDIHRSELNTCRAELWNMKQGK
jgi:chromosome segregation ATPase